MQGRLALLFFSCFAVLFITEIVSRFLDIGDPPVFKADPNYGYLMEPDQSVSTRGIRFRINRAGFRGPDLVSPKPAGEYRIALLGDSLTYGGGAIADNELFTNRVASTLRVAMHRQIETSNISAPGWGIENIAAYVETRSLRETDLLVWVIPAADFRRPKTSLEDYGFPTRKPWTRVSYLLSGLIVRAKGRVQDSLLKSPPDAGDDHPIRDRNVHVLTRVLTEFTAAGGRAVVVFVPSGQPTTTERDDLVVYHAAAESIAVPWIDVGPLMARYRSQEMFLDGVHLTSQGHAVVADEIAKFVVEDAGRH